MKVLDLFSGAGGLSEGFHNEDYKVIAQIEKDKWACETLTTRTIFHFLKNRNDLNTYYKYLKNGTNYKSIKINREFIYKKYPELKEIIDHQILNKKFGNPQNDKEATSLKELSRLIESALKFNDENNIDLIIGGPPCQAYSIVGRSRMKETAEKDSRNFLFYYYLNLVKEYKPKAFIFENVPGILTAKKGRVFEKIKHEFNNCGYEILTGPSNIDKDNVLDFGEFGVVQKRKRVLLFGFRKEFDFNYPDFTGNKYHWNHELTTQHLLSDLPALLPGDGDDHNLIQYIDTKRNLTDYQKYIRKDSIGIMNHKARNIHERDRKIYELSIKLAERGTQLKYPDLPDELKTHQNEKSFLDRFKVHTKDKIPHTVVAHISKDGHYNIHPDINQCRSLTVREAARIQGFPDNYLFEGPRTAQFVQVGNAVPPIMSTVIAKTIKTLVKGN
ncbi:DNA cytosine methyltransferase [Oceanobacillus kimchii]|uniref:Cytosine-specific methyltransferase n=1 Tax=Oceanobacillus kimchii TaxID=746691 RepID=A0ABQ5TEJ4_9BACI|nr:DNA (cytosine-5-)-methyltransferase [Oceanobacillus kimchii]GLO64432.1 restriction endonuclease subunit M [Oceanobacillus kimchii]